ncbi:MULTISPECIES: ABC transporter ATP-binding protein [unclassified Variovorax]|uniref:ABC transporter ATP-binding protein n=1 Tax=unclassified Variovorax TaxID=663243 RepID=UPI001BD3B4D9|nr:MULTISPECIES: ABC transporter ATP-binding protein [unclassified Variovorax]
MSLLELDGVSRQFGGLWAVRGVSLSVPAGRITGLIGPNGAGKSTIVNMIAGLTALTEGRILLDGAEIHRQQPGQVARLGIARTFQNVRLLNEASVVENIAVACHHHQGVSAMAEVFGLGTARAAQAQAYARARELIAMFDMERYSDFLAGELSYGHQRRVEIMRALAMKPRVVLLDEPVAGMNDVEAQQLAVHFRRLASEGIALLLIEHNMQFVMSLSDQVHVIAAGELMTSGTPREVRNDPRVIAAYLGDEQCSA